MRKIKGFTLVELLVVIAIIAMLLSILVPALGKAREQGRRIVCANNQKTMGVGDRIYSQESDDWHVPIFNGLNSNNWLWFQNPLFVKIIAMKGRFNREESEGYSASGTMPQDFKCPTDKRTVANGGLLRYGNAKGASIEGVSFGMNSVGLRSKACRDWCYYDKGPDIRKAHTLKTLAVVSPSNKFFIMDSEWAYVDYWEANYLTCWDLIGDKMGGPDPDGNWHWDAPAYRHREGANMVFYDGHIKYLSKKQIFKVNDDGFEQFNSNKPTWFPIPDRWYIDPPYHL